MTAVIEGPPMPGGTMGEVRRVGSTVRRPAGPWTPQIQSLMRELRARGLLFVPEPYGLDDVGRESVEFVDGDVGVYPMPEWVWSAHLLVQVGQALRRLHDATRDLPKPGSGWQREPVQPADVVCHSDVAPYNVVCRDGHLVAIIDWDFAVPAPAGWDLGYAAYRWISLTAPENHDGRVADLAEQERRLEVLAEAYGDVQPDELVRWAVVRLDDLAELIEARASAGDERFTAAVAGGHPELYRRDAQWIRDCWGIDT